MRLFKYVSAERFDVLENELIRFSPASALNDPWEVKPHLEQFISDEGLREISNRRAKNPIAQREEDFKLFWKTRRKTNHNLSQKQAREMFAQWILENPHKLALAQKVAENYALREAKKRDPHFKEEFFKQFEELGVLSLTEEPNNLLMWAHYCDCHKGFIFEIDPEHTFVTLLKKHAPVKTIRPIVYADKLPHLKEYKDVFKDNHGLDALLFTKDQRWSYEKEWRLVADYRDANIKKELPNGEIAWLYQIPADCIKRVVLGCLMSQANKDKITQFLRTDLRYKHVQLQQAVRVQREYNLDFEDL